MMELQDLNDNARAWRDHVKAIPFISYKKDFENLIENSISVYIAAFIVNTETQEKIKYYVGCGNAKARANAHKSEYLNCKNTSYVGKSKLYTNEFLNGAKSHRMEFLVHSSGYKLDDAKMVEHQVCRDLIQLFGDDVITQPTKYRKLSQQ